MAKVKMTDYVRHPESGEVATLGTFADRGMIEFRKVHGFMATSKGNPRIAYFADIKGTSTGWEIGKLAYLSRTNQEVTV